MNVYILLSEANKYQPVVFKNEEDWDLLEKFDGSRFEGNWPMPSVQLLAEDESGNRLKVGDCPSLATHVPVFSTHATTSLKPLLQGNGQAFKLRCNDQTYFAINITRVVDALDESRSQLKRFKNTNDVMDIVSHVFVKPQLVGLTIFKIPQVPLMNVYVTDDFVGLVKAQNLKGFDFKLVWTG